MDDGTLLGMNWYVKGIDDQLPQVFDHRGVLNPLPCGRGCRFALRNDG